MKLIEVTKSLYNQPTINRKYYIIVDSDKKEDIDKQAYEKAESAVAFQYMAHNIEWEEVDDIDIKRKLMYQKLNQTLIEHDTIEKQKDVVYEQINKLLNINIIDYIFEDGVVKILSDENGWEKINI